MLYKASKLGSSTNLRNSVAGFAYCSLVVFQANVMPHPPLRSRPTSAGATRTYPALLAEKGYLVLLLLEVTIIIIIIIIIIQPFQLGCCE